MPRVPGPWYRASRKMWYVTIGGVQVSLDVRGSDNRAEALEALKVLLEATQAKRAGNSPPAPARTVREAAAEFLERRRPKLSPEWFRQHAIALGDQFVAAFGGRAVASLAAEEVEEWADRPGWSASTQNTRLGIVAVFLKWAGHPLRLDKPAKESRGADAVVSPERLDAFLADALREDCGSDLPDLVRVLNLTGARPGEGCRLTAENVDWPNACSRLKQHKTAKKTGRPRVIHFPAAAVEILERQRAKYGSGPLFRTKYGNAFDPDRLRKRLDQLSRRSGIKVIGYGAGRHSFATNALCGGVPDTVVAALLGHTSTAMTHRNYGHVGEQARVLKAAVEQVSKPKAG